MVYDQPLDWEVSLRVYRVRLWEHGHSMEEIDEMSLNDFGDVIGYWAEKDRAETKLSEQRQNKRSARARA